ncbi:MAG: tetratricopeptide repeat protein [Flavobacteriales bacterium]
MDYLQQQKLDDLFFEADALIKEKRFTEAVSTLEVLLIEAPDFGKAYNHLGWIYETQYRDKVKAEDFYRKCIAYSPEYTAVYLNLSITLSGLGKYDEQEKLLQQALTIQGIDQPGMHNELGILHELRGDFDKAIASYRQAVMLTLIDTNLDIYMASIERCKKKKNILSNI